MASIRRLLTKSKCSCCRQFIELRRGKVKNLRYMSSYEEARHQEDLPEQSIATESTRDPYAVLQALSSTVRSVPDSPPYGFFDDPFLMPKSLNRKKEYLMALQSGKEAAKYVLKKYPDLTRLRQPVPDWRENLEIFEEKEDEPTLNYYITGNDVAAAIKLYEKLIGDGKELSLLTLNRVLDLVGFHGIGNQVVRTGPLSAMGDEKQNVAAVSEDSKSSSSSSSSDEENETKAGDSVGARVSAQKHEGSSVWRNDNYAETMFAQMKERDGATYEAFILALLKHEENSRAFELHNEMLSEGLQGSSFLYKSLLNTLNKMSLQRDEKWSRAEEILKKMNKEPAVKPDIDVFNALLELIYVLGMLAPKLAAMIIREMVSIGVEPSLASYLFVLKIYTSRKIYSPPLIRSIIARLRNQNIKVRHERDVEFFSVAMAVAKEHNDADIAKEIYNLAYLQGNKQLLGQKSRAFHANYLSTLAIGEGDTDFVFAEYGRLVPNEFLPREWNYVDFCRRIKRENQPGRIVRLYQDIKRGSPLVGISLFRNVFHVLSCDISQEEAEPLLSIAEDMWKTMEATNLHATPVMLNELIKLYGLCGKFELARNEIMSSAVRGIMLGSKGTCYLLDACVAAKDIEATMKTLELVQKLNLDVSSEVIQNILQSLDLTENEQQFVHGLVKSEDRRIADTSGDDIQIS